MTRLEHAKRIAVDFAFSAETVRYILEKVGDREARARLVLTLATEYELPPMFVAGCIGEQSEEQIREKLDAVPGEPTPWQGDDE